MTAADLPASQDRAAATSGKVLQRQSLRHAHGPMRPGLRGGCRLGPHAIHQGVCPAQRCHELRHRSSCELDSARRTPFRSRRQNG
jgi:hypothetical protein